MIEFGVLDAYDLLLNESDSEILQLTLLGISNLNCGVSEITKKVIDKGIFIKIFQLIATILNKDPNSKEENKVNQIKKRSLKNVYIVLSIR